MDRALMNNLINALMMTLQNTIAAIGPLPREICDPVKKILSGTDTAAMLALGCYLDEARESRDYSELVTGLINAGQA